MSYIQARDPGTSACGGMGGTTHTGFDSTSAFWGPLPRIQDRLDHSLSEEIDVSYAVLSDADDLLQHTGRLQRSTSALRNWTEETTPDHVAREHADDPLSRETTRTAIHELRRLSGLTWDQLARLFGVDRRSLHHWGSGQPLSRKNEERLHRLLAVIRHIDRGAADLNRQALLQPTDDGDIPFDLLVQGEYQAVKDILGRGPGRRIIQRKPLSPEEQALHRPAFKPVELLDARHDPVHVEMKGSRVPRVVRSRKKQ